MAQVGVNPPTFILFVNYPNLMTDFYKKYLYNQFREAYAFSGVPIRIYLRGKQKKEQSQHTAKSHFDGLGMPTEGEEAVESNEEAFFGNPEELNDLDEMDFIEDEDNIKDDDSMHEGY